MRITQSEQFKGVMDHKRGMDIEDDLFTLEDI